MDYITNSTGTCVFKIDSIEKVEIVEDVAETSSSFRVIVEGATVSAKAFEVAGTLDAAKALAAPILAAIVD